MTDSDLIEVALFPIPNLVAFPGTVVPLHVFEPRYRQLVADCVDTGRMIAVCHTVKTIHQPAQAKTVEEALSSNQATYKPQTVFSAGDCEVMDTTPDGRIIARIHMKQRLELVSETQSLPYRIAACRPISDELESDSEISMDLQRLINGKLLAMVGDQNATLSEALSAPEWAEQPVEKYSFALFQHSEDLMWNWVKRGSAKRHDCKGDLILIFAAGPFF